MLYSNRAAPANRSSVFLGKVKNISEFKFDEILNVFVLKYLKVRQELVISFLSLLKLHLSLKSLIQLLGKFVLVSILFDECQH